MIEEKKEIMRKWRGLLNRVLNSMCYEAMFPLLHNTLGLIHYTSLNMSL